MKVFSANRSRIGVAQRVWPLLAAGLAVAWVIASGCSAGPDADSPSPLPPPPAPTATPSPVQADRGPVPPILRELLPSGPREFDETAFEQLLGRDGIKPIYTPEIGTHPEAGLDGTDLVLGVSLGGESRAYPVSTMRFKEIVNDDLGGVDILVTWCQLCYTAMVHDRRVNGEVLTFGNQGALYMKAMTWWDRQTRSIWSQPWGTAISGPLEGTALTLIPSSVVPWATRVAEHPDTTVLMNILDRERVRVQVSRDDFVIGVALGDSATAYRYELASESRVINDRIGEHPVVLFVDPVTPDIKVFSRRPIGGQSTASELSFRMNDAGFIVDRQTGSTWDAVSGVATEGPLEGVSLQQLPHTTAFDWAWQDFFPHTSFFGSVDVDSAG